MFVFFLLEGTHTEGNEGDNNSKVVIIVLGGIQLILLLIILIFYSKYIKER